MSWLSFATRRHQAQGCSLGFLAASSVGGSREMKSSKAASACPGWSSVTTSINSPRTTATASRADTGLRAVTVATTLALLGSTVWALDAGVG
jgi:hypothetical protein